MTLHLRLLVKHSVALVFTTAGFRSMIITALYHSQAVHWLSQQLFECLTEPSVFAGALWEIQLRDCCKEEKIQFLSQYTSGFLIADCLAQCVNGQD